MPQVVQFPIQPQTIPVQVPINTGNGQTIYQTVNVPIQCFSNQFSPQMQIQPQMQIFPQMTQQLANIITPSGQIQQVQLASVPFLQQPLPTQQVLKPDATLSQDQSASSSAQPITISNTQGQQIIIPTQLMRPSNQNIIQLNPNVSVPTQIQHIPGIGNVQVISANALNSTPFMSHATTVCRVLNCGKE